MFRVLFTTIWLCSIAIGVLFMANYSTKPGPTGERISSWPAESPIDRPAGESMLLVYLHPHCPCSRATVSELARLLAKAPELQVRVCCYCPITAEADWPLSSLYEKASRLSSQNPWHDQGGVEAKRMGILTSGHVMFFDANGGLCFSGGVTAGRGHEGANPGLLRLNELLNSLGSVERESVSVFPVYGCEIESRS